MIGLSIGNYRILEKLNGAETIGKYKAVDTPINRDVYIKVLGREFFDRADVLESFHSEAATLAKLSHPCVPTLHSLTAVDNQLFMILEFFNGQKLARILQNQGKLAVGQAVSIVIHILDCLEHAGSVGVRHGDLTIENVVLTDDGNVKILGFGTFQADETSESENNAGENSDIYAAGIMLYEMLTGEKPPFEVKDEAELNILKFTIPEELRETLVKALSRNSNENFQTAAEFRNALAEIYPGNETLQNVFISKTSSLGDFASLSFLKNEFSAENEFEKNPDGSTGEKTALVKFPLLRRLRQKRYAAAAVAIAAVIVLHFVFQFSFIQKQNLRLAEESVRSAPLDALPDEKPEPRQEAEKEIIETKNRDYESKFEGVKAKPKIVSTTPVRPPPEKSPPARKAVKKKAPAESRAERLRRAEKILTGI